MAQILPVMRLRDRRLILLISALAVSDFSCHLNASSDDCSDFDAITVAVARMVAGSSNLNLNELFIIEELSNINHIFEADVEAFKHNGFKAMDCEERRVADSDSLRLISLQDVEPGLVMRSHVVNFSFPCFKDANGNAIIFVSTTCGNDCGTIDVYKMKEEGEKWRVVEVVTLATM